MSSFVATFVMMNNYFHDVAISTIFALSIMLSVSVKVFEETHSKAAEQIIQDLRRVLLWCLMWLFAGGVVRILAFKSYELSEAIKKDITEGLLIKHILAFLIVLTGAVLWKASARRYRQIKENKDSSSD